MKLKLLFIALLFFYSCGESFPTSGGVKIPNLLKGKVVNSDNTPASGVGYLSAVSVIDANNHRQVIDSVELDKDGFYKFENDFNGNYVVEVVSKNQATFINDIHFTEKSDSIFPPQALLSQRVTVIGRLLDGLQADVFIPGTQTKSITNDKGIYTLDNVSTGRIDLSFMVEDDSIIFIPVDISSANDTLYIQDVLLSFSQETENYPSEKTSLITQPVSYTDSVPDWYDDKDFDGVEYPEFDSSLIPTKILLLTDSFLTSGDSILAKMLKDEGYEISYAVDSKVSSADSVGYDGIIVTYKADVVGMDTTFIEMVNSLEKPVLTMETTIAEKFNMLEYYATAKDTLAINILESDHFISDGLSGYTKIANYPISFYVGKVASGGTTIARTLDRSELSVIYTYNKGDSLAVGVAPEKRVGFHFKRASASNMNSTGKNLFLKAVEWMFK